MSAFNPPPPWRPTPWLAAVLSFVLFPAGLLYVDRRLLAWGCYLLLSALLAASLISSQTSPPLSMAMLATAILVFLAVPALSFWLASRYPENQRRSTATRPLPLAGLYLVLLLTPGFLFWLFGYQVLTVFTEQMLPTISYRDRILVTRHGVTYLGPFGPVREQPEIKRGDIVVFRMPGKPPGDYVQRVIGLPGDVVAYDERKQLTINDQPVTTRPARQRPDWLASWVEARDEMLDSHGYTVVRVPNRPAVQRMAVEPFPNRERCHYAWTEFRCEVPPNHYFLMGDNRDQTKDSRYWGFLPAQNLRGKVLLVLPGEDKD